MNHQLKEYKLRQATELINSLREDIDINENDDLLLLYIKTIERENKELKKKNEEYKTFFKMLKRLLPSSTFEFNFK